MKKIISLILIISIITLGFIGCSPDVEKEEQSKDEPKQEEIAQEDESKENDVTNKDKDRNNFKAVVLSGPTAITMTTLLKDKPVFDGKNIEYEVVNAPDVMTARLLSGEADFAVIPTNLGAKLYNKGKDKFNYKIAASTVWGVLYVISTEEIAAWEDLKGKEIVTIGKGLTPDILFRYLAEENGINPDEDLNIEYLPSPQELAQTMIAGKSKIAVMPQPLLSAVLMQNKDVKIALDLQDEWEKVTGLESYPQSSLVIENELIENYPGLVEGFLEKYEESINWTNENPEGAGVIIEELNIGLKAKIAERSIPDSNLKFVGANEARAAIDEYLGVLKNFSPDSIGGELPSDEFYMER